MTSNPQPGTERSVSVFGLGYVGCVTAACLADRGFAVVGVDVSQSKVDLLASGRATIVEEGIAELVQAAHQSGRLRATVSVAEAIASTSISLICVGTPSQPNGNLDLSYVERVCVQIGEALRHKQGRHTVVIRSTVFPGTTQSLARPALERASGKVAGRDFGLAMNPEFLREGSSIRDFNAPPFTVIGTEDPDTGRAVAALYEGIEAPLHVVATGVAEMLKYACNAYHGLKVGFANEIGNICKALGVDSHEVMRLFVQDTKLNVSKAYLMPGFAFGGSCLPKDLRAITYRARQLDIATPILSGTLESNDEQVTRVYNMVMAAGNRRVGVLGLAFKEGTDDLRESPMVTLVERLIGKGMDVAIYDREVSQARLIGSNREFIEREIPHVWTLFRPSVDDVLLRAETVIIGNGSAEFRGIEPRLREGQVVIDLVRAFAGRRSDGRTYEGICW
ncbi:MAG: nucleotide sugar dehydrogenase [Gemmatimonadaceae bacterium]|nr:nucleotide sugar dehydrogenase [Gemmatimonadaceae bacterium]